MTYKPYPKKIDTKIKPFSAKRNSMAAPIKNLCQVSQILFP